MNKKRVKLLLKASIIISTAIVTMVIVSSALLVIFQDKLLFPREKRVEVVTVPNDRMKSNVREIDMQVDKGIELKGWIVKNGMSKDNNLLLYFGGNAEEISHMIEKAEGYEGWTTVLLNYRGYGESLGRPSEKNLCADAIKIYDYFIEGEEYDFDKVVVMGRSIGTGVATYVAYEKEVDGVILVSPYDSLVNVIDKKALFLPIDLMIKHKFDSIGRASLIEAPVDIIIATEDTTIKPPHSRRLACEWKGKVDIRVIEGENHNSLLYTEEYRRLIKEFLNKY